MPGSVALLGGLTTLPSEPQDDRRTDDAERRCDHSRATEVLAARKREGILLVCGTATPAIVARASRSFQLAQRTIKGSNALYLK